MVHRRHSFSGRWAHAQPVTNKLLLHANSRILDDKNTSIIYKNYGTVILL